MLSGFTSGFAVLPGMTCQGWEKRKLGASSNWGCAFFKMRGWILASLSSGTWVALVGTWWGSKVQIFFRKK
jgi:hypothetical protein